MFPIRFRRAALAALFTACTIGAQAQSALSEASALSMLPVTVSIAAPVMILSAGAMLTVVAVEATSAGLTHRSLPFARLLHRPVLGAWPGSNGDSSISSSTSVSNNAAAVAESQPVPTLPADRNLPSSDTPSRRLRSPSSSPYAR